MQPQPLRNPDAGGATGPSGGDRPDPERTTYYGRPSLKPAPFENPVVGSYIFLPGCRARRNCLRP